MTIPSFAAGSFTWDRNTSTLIGIGNQLTNLQTKLSTGQNAQTYSGLGDGRVTALQFQQQLAQANGFAATAADVSQRITFVNNTLDALNKSSSSFVNSLKNNLYGTNGLGVATTQGLAKGSLESAIDSLNSRYGDRYLFSGRSSSTQPIANADTLINGDATHDGLRQVVVERNQADLGIIAAAPPAVDPASSGRLQQSLAGTAASINEDVAGSPFGFKLTAAAPASTTANIIASGPSGAQNSVSFNVAAQPVAGDSVSFTLSLPDGTTQKVTLTAANTVTGGGNISQFQIGATTAQTAANLSLAVTASLNINAATNLKAASSVTAAQSFFSNTGSLPLRVGTLPATTAITLIAGNAAGAKATEPFYSGDNQPTGSTVQINAVRNSIATRIDTNTNIGLGIQANETGIANALAGFALLATESFNKADSNDQAHLQALTQRIASNVGNPNIQSLIDIQAQIATVSITVKNTQSKLTQKISQYQDLIDGVEKADKTSISTSLLALQTQLEASYQTTSILSKLSLANFLK